LRADADGNGQVDQADYDLWKAKLEPVPAPEN
jgi:hypothetical protein